MDWISPPSIVLSCRCLRHQAIASHEGELTAEEMAALAASLFNAPEVKPLTAFPPPLISLPPSA